ncbi:MAG: PAS domain S-box protein [Verrucomicrobia bacterium]|nr:PAS domain S-box protein [Verrucomicrobiota bacterium]
MVPPVAAVVATLCGLLGWAGWLWNAPLLSRWWPDMPAMSPNTATACLLGGLALGLCLPLAWDGNAPLPPARRKLVSLLAAGLCCLGAFKLVEYGFGLDLGFKNLLYAVPQAEISAASPVRMAPHTALAFVLLGPALWLLCATEQRRWRLAPWLALGPALIALASFVGHCYGVIFALPFYGLLDRMALSTATALGMLSLGVIYLRPEERPIALLRDRGVAGATLRRLLPATLLLPLILGWFERLGAEAGLWGSALGDAIVAVLTTVLLAAFVWRSALNAHAAQRQLERAQADLENRVRDRTTELSAANAQLLATALERRHSEQMLETVVEGAAVGFTFLDTERRFVRINQAFARMNGLPREAHLGRTLREVLPDLADAFEPLLDDVLASGQPVVNREIVSPIGAHPPTRHWRVSFYPIQGAGEMLAGVGIFAEDITSDKAAAQALAESDERFRVAFAEATIGLSLARPDGRMLLVNRALAELTGYTQEELLGRDFRTIVHPDDMERNLALFRSMIAGARRGYTIEKRYVRKDGTPVWVQNSVSLTRDSEGRPATIIKLTENVTERKLAEEALRLSEERHRLAITAARLGTFYCPVPLGEIIWNDQCKEHFWLPPDAKVDFDLFYSLLHPDDREPTRQALERALTEHATYDVEYRTCAPDGSGRYRWVRAIGRGYYDEATGELTRFDGITADITEHKKADAELRQSEARFRELVSAGGPIIWRAEPDGNFKAEAPRWEEFTGHARGDAAGWGWTRAVHPADLAGAEKIWRRALAEQTPFELEYRLRRHDGVYRYVSVRGAPVRNESTGEVTEWIGTITDVHERASARAEREALLLREQNARALAEEANRSKDEFLATLSHELRTPLNAILGWAHLLRGDGPADQESWTTGLEVIERNTRAQVQLIEDLLDVSRIITGKLRLDVRPVDLGDVIHAALDTVRPAAEARGVRLQPLLDPRAGPVSGDPDRLQQVIWNLLTNAIKFTPRDGRVQVRLERANSHAEISVADTGQGIAPEFLPFLFDRFRQADSSTTRRHGGLGLGLAIVKNLVEMHGGTVGASSPGKGGGTTLTVRLPLLVVHRNGGEGAHRGAAGEQDFADAKTDEAGPAAFHAPGTITNEPDNGNHPLAGLRILVVDDEKDALDLLNVLLSRAGAKVMTARNADEAFALFIKHATDSPPELLISDIGMPGEDGYSLIRRVRALGSERGGSLPAIALTAHARADDRIRALAAGFDLQAAKPIDPAELILIVERLADRVMKKTPGGESREA